MRQQKEIKFTKLYIEGFFSIIEPLEYRLDQLGLNLLQGDNGSGKTTILSGLPWSLFGIDLKGRRNPEPYDAIKTPDYKGTRVHSYFEVNGDKYEVIRLNKYKGKIDGVKGGSRVILKINNLTCEEYRDKSDYNKAIIDILGMDYTIMVNSVIFGQGLKTLVQEKGAKRKQVFDELFRVDYINRAKDIALEKRRSIETDLRELEHKEASLISERELAKAKRINIKQKVSAYEDNKANLSEKISTATNSIQKVKGHKSRIKGIEAELKKTKKTHEKLQSIKAELSDVEKEELRMSFSMNDIIHRPDELLQEIKEVMSDKLDKTCPKCGKPANEDEISKLKKGRKKKIKELKEQKKIAQIHKKNKEKAYQELKSKIGSLKSQLSKIELKTVDREKLIKEHSRLESELSGVKGLGAKIEKWQNELSKLKKPSMKSLKKLNSTIKRCDKALDNLGLSHLRAELERYKWVIDTPLSNSGLKAYIFNERLDAVNERLEFYTQYIGLRPRFEVNLDSARKDIDIKLERFGQEIKHEDLSGGQAQLVDVIALFAIHDVFSQSVNCNIIITDEIFKFLDIKNIQVVSELLKLKSKDKANHVITHNPDLRMRNAFITNVVYDGERTAIAA